MVDPLHLEILNQGVSAWNKWREENPHIKPNLIEADLKRYHLEKYNLQDVKLNGAYLDNAFLQGANLDRANLHRAQLVSANLQGARLWHAHLAWAYLQKAILQGACLISADLIRVYLSYAHLENAQLQLAELNSADLRLADLTGACLQGAKLQGAYLADAHLNGASLQGADLQGAYFWNASLQGADLTGANLTGAVLCETDVTDVILNDCKVYSAAIWDINGEPKEQKNLMINRPGEAVFTVDNLEIAHFIYMIRHRKKLREVIREATSKVVLILGRFTEKRCKVLEAVQDELRKQTDADGKAKYIPVIFDFPPAESRDIMETVQILVGLSHFVIADISDPKGVLVELTAIVPHWDVPVKLIIEDSRGGKPVKMLNPLTKYAWIDNTIYGYCDIQKLRRDLKEKVIDPLEEMVEKKKQREFTITAGV
jgi:uncharacterized protein YjbI with pentapeptide repeats